MGVTLHIRYPIYTQPGTVPKEHRNSTLVSYSSALQTIAEHSQEIQNVATPHQSKRNCIVFYNALDNESFPKLPQKKQHYNNTQEEKDNNSLSNETVTTWREELQEKLAETIKLLEENNHTKEKELEVHLHNTLNATLKEFQGTLLREFSTMISTQLEQQMKTMNVSIRVFS